MKTNRKHYLAATASLLIATPLLQAQTTAWGSSIVGNPLGYYSDGSVISDTAPVQLGWFTNGFTPTAGNMSQWATNWNPVATASHQDLGGYFGVSAEYSSSSENAPEMTKQAYVFAFNDLSLLGQPGFEALLYREDGYVFPTVPNADTFDIADNIGDTKDDGFTVIWGRLDRDISNPGGVLAGGGEFSNLLADATGLQWEFQLGGIAAVPEPSSALLGLVGIVAFMRRRRN